MSQTKTQLLEQNVFSRAFARAGLMPGFTVSIFLSALLLFSVQPMFAKMTLPLLGGAPNVWNTAMVFFQATLLAGYLYAHFLSKYAPLKIQIAIHAGVLMLGIAFLPLAVANGWTPPDTGAPAIWLMALYGVSIGLPFFALSATAPLLQRWFSYTDHKNAHDPYFLYAASNLGSLMSLLSYPVLIEPMLGVSQQSNIWTFGYYALAIAIVCSGVLSLANRSSKAIDTDVSNDSEDNIVPGLHISWTKRAIWVGLAFVPSSLMLGVTTHFSVNVASAPFVWVAPLAIYLATFVIVFTTKPLISEELTGKMLPLAVVAGLLLGHAENGGFFVQLGSHLLIFFVITLRFHGRLAALRPAADKLTEFYIFMSVGGVLGGIFNALIAPVIFDNVYEYSLVLAISGIAAAGAWPNARSIIGDIGFAVVTFALFAAVVIVIQRFTPEMSILVNVALISAYAVAFLQNGKPLRFVGALLAIQIFMVSIAPSVIEEGNRGNIFTDRSFFGVTRVTKLEREGQLVHQFVHGNTIHNIQFRNPALRSQLISYFSKPGPYGQLMDAMRQRSNAPLEVQVIGLGAGALACYAEPGDRWSFYEIDPAIAEMASNPKYFTYLNDCTPDAPIILGDARLKIQEVEAGTLDLLIVDAFSSDAIPAHLVTREALALYRSKMKEDGIIFFHTSNRFVDVSSVVLTLAADAGLAARELKFIPAEDAPYLELLSPATAVVVAPDGVMAHTFDSFVGWKSNTPNPAVGLWTDDYSHIIGALMAAKNGGTIVNEQARNSALTLDNDVVGR